MSCARNYPASLGGILAMTLGHAARSLTAGIVLNDIGPEIDASGILRAAPGAPLDPWPAWRALRDLPTLAIRGARSDILSTGTFARMKAEMPTLQQVSVGNRGHAPLLDEPECLGAIDGFLSSLDL